MWIVLKVVAAGLLATCGLVASASACLYSFLVFFDFERAVVSTQGKNTLESFRGTVRDLFCRRDA